MKGEVKNVTVHLGGEDETKDEKESEAERVGWTGSEG